MFSVGMLKPTDVGSVLNGFQQRPFSGNLEVGEHRLDRVEERMRRAGQSG